MTHEEFKTWLASHFAKFTGAARQFDGLPSRSATIAAWFGVLKSHAAADCEIASQSLFAEAPHTWLDEQPAEIARRARRLAHERSARDIARDFTPTARETTYACHHCRDTRWRFALQPFCERALREGTWRRKFAATAVVRCDCQPWTLPPGGKEHPASLLCHSHVPVPFGEAGIMTIERAIELIAEHDRKDFSVDTWQSEFSYDQVVGAGR